ncbi:RagB/SusD family nutrient uptake outer membrane protein [Prevotella sp.]|uniref:RagB/SusD family nutrient uptake outer membrane protein n=1 Tax=Prevotella sp. TaxID=59823 RepID=UPI0030776167
MKTNIFSRIALATVITAGALSLGSCDDFLDHQTPQGTLDETQVKDPSRIDNLVISAYAVYMSAEDINSSFSMWNFDVRSDDAYKGGNGTSDGDVFHQLEISQGILTTNWNISSMWERLYNCISRVNTALAQLEKIDAAAYPLKDERVAEMKFLRAYGHFLLKRLYKNIPFVTNPDLNYDDYNNLSNTQYTNDEGWQLIINDLEDAYKVLPVKQAEVGRPSKAAAAAFLTKVYLYKAYHQDDATSNKVTSISADDLKKVVEYSDPSIYQAGGFDLEADFHNNFRPETQYENGVESIWAIQYSMNDGTKLGNLNWSYGLIVPNIPGVTDGGCDFYKPSQNLVNAFRTQTDGLPYLDTFNDKDYDKATDYADPRLFLTVGIPGLPYEFNKKYMMDESDTWSRSHGLYGYYVTLKQNVDPDCGYLIKGSWWGTAENRIVLRYADVLLERAEALVQLNDGRINEAIALVNKLRTRAKHSLGVISNYETDYGVHFNISTYDGSYNQAQALKIVKMERRLEMGMECERFFDLVRWGEAAEVLNKYYAEEAGDCSIYKDAKFTKDRNEYLPIPFSQISASNGHYTQNIGNW